MCIRDRTERGNKEESVNSSEENLNIVCMSNEPSGNKAMLGHVAPNLNLSVSESSLSFVNHPNLICLPEGLRAAAPITKTLTPGPKISEKSVNLSLQVGKSGSTSKPLENIFPANPASKSPFQEQQINCLLYTSPSPRDQRGSRMPSSA